MTDESIEIGRVNIRNYPTLKKWKRGIRFYQNLSAGASTDGHAHHALQIFAPLSLANGESSIGCAIATLSLSIHDLMALYTIIKATLKEHAIVEVSPTRASAIIRDAATAVTAEGDAMKVTAETLTNEHIIIQRGEAASDITEASRLHYLCQSILDSTLDAVADFEARTRIAAAINARKP